MQITSSLKLLRMKPLECSGFRIRSGKVHKDGFAIFGLGESVGVTNNSRDVVDVVGYGVRLMG